MRRIFIGANNTNAGKTLVTRAIAASMSRKGARVAALKPIETGVSEAPSDAVALADACQNPSLVQLPGFVRRKLALAPYACALLGEPAIDFTRLISAIEVASSGVDFALVEGAGGVLTPIDEQHSMADLAVAIEADCVLVARDELGALSTTLSAVESLHLRRANVSAIVLTRHGDAFAMNKEILRRRLPNVPVLSFSITDETTDALAIEAERSGLIRTLLGQ